ncbi:MAG: aspartate-semialdehyde dehydrogenase [bacterium]
MKTYNIAIVGATGAVGEIMRKILEERNFPINKLKLLASFKSKGKKIQFKNDFLEVEELTNNSFANIDFALFSAGADRSKEFCPIAASCGTISIDNSSAFRMDTNVPLVVPEVNPEDIKKHKGIIANPNCSTIQMVVALKPIYDKVGIKRIVVSTYQAVSGKGLKAMEELKQQTQSFLENKEIVANVFPYQIAFNLLPHIDVFLENGYSKEEMKMIEETKKIMGDENIQVSPTTVRVPVFGAHSESINIETKEKISVDELKKLLSNSPGIKVIDDLKNQQYPFPIMAEGKNEVFVGRIREDLSIANGINIWVVSDNLRKGAALNAIQIMEKIIGIN